MNPFSQPLPNAQHGATARAALTTAMAVRADCPIMRNDAVIQLSANAIQLPFLPPGVEPVISLSHRHRPRKCPGEMFDL